MIRKLFLTIAILLTLTSFVNAADPFFTDVIVTSTDGIWTDSRAYPSLSDAITAVGANDRVITIVNEQTVANLTIPSNVTLRFERDGTINVSGTLTIHSKAIEAPDRQIFTGAGTAIFNDGSVIRSSWYSDLVEAISSISNSVTLVISEPYTISSNIAIPSDVELKWETPENQLSVNAGFTVSGIKNIDAGDFVLFTGGGDFDFEDGVSLNLNWFRRLRSVITWVESELATIVIPKTATVDYSDTLTSNEILDFSSRNGQLNISAGVTLTIDSPDNIISGNSQQIFLGNGTVAFTRGGIRYLEWWGTNATAMQAAIDSGGQLVGQDTYGESGTVVLSGRQYTWDTQIDIYSHMHIRGAGVGATEILFTGSDYCFAGVNNSNLWSVSDLTISGNSSIVPTGGIYVGNVSGESGYTAYVDIQKVDIKLFSSVTAIGLHFENPSHIGMTSVNVDNIPNGTAFRITSNMAVTGNMHFSACKFGERVNTSTGFEIVTGDNVVATVLQISFDGCFTGGTTRGLHIQAPSGSGNIPRGIVFTAHHWEVSNATVGAIAGYIEAGEEIIVNSLTMHNNNPSGDNTDYGLVLKNTDDLINISLNGLEAANLPAEGIALYIDDSGPGNISNISLHNNINFVNCDTDSTRIKDDSRYLVLLNSPKHNRIINGNFYGWSIGASSDPDFWVSSSDGLANVARNVDEKFSTYSVDLSRTGGTYAALDQKDQGYTDLLGIYVTFGAWIKAAAGEVANLSIVDTGGTSTVSAPDDGNWRWVSIGRKIDSATTYVTYRLTTSSSSGVLYDGACAVVGSGLNDYTANWMDNRVLQYYNSNYDFPNLLDNTMDTTDFTVNGAELGDLAMFSINSNNPLIVTVAVTASNTVKVIRLNRTGINYDLAATQIRIRVWKRLAPL